MPAQLKHAWLDLVTGTTALLTYLALLPFVGPERAMVALPILAAGAFAPLLYRRPKGTAAVVTDELDRLVHLRALAVSWAVLWLFFVAFCMTTWHLHRGGTVRAELFPIMVGAGYVLVTVSRAAATIVMYHRYTAAPAA